jgi:hypothetical protein
MVWFFFVEQKEPATTHQRTNKRIVFAKMIVVLLAVKTLYPKLPIWAKYFGHGYSIPISKVHLFGQPRLSTTTKLAFLVSPFCRIMI